MLVFSVGSVSNDFGSGVAEHAISIDTPPMRNASTASCSRPAFAPTRAGARRAGHGRHRDHRCGRDGRRARCGDPALDARACRYGLDTWIRSTTSGSRSSRRRPDPAAAVRDDRGRRDRASRELDVAVHTARSVVEVDGRWRAHRERRVLPGRSRRVGGRHPAPAGSPTSTASRSIAVTSSSSRTTLQTTRDPDIFALGDCAACPWPEAGAKAIVPPRAQVAQQQATLLVEDDAARGSPASRCRCSFRDYGSLVSLGELSAVGTLMGRLIGGSLLVQGLIARWMYVSLYKLHQVSLFGFCASCSIRSAACCAADRAAGQAALSHDRAGRRYVLIVRLAHAGPGPRRQWRRSRWQRGVRRARGPARVCRCVSAGMGVICPHRLAPVPAARLRWSQLSCARARAGGVSLFAASRGAWMHHAPRGLLAATQRSYAAVRPLRGFALRSEDRGGSSAPAAR